MRGCRRTEALMIGLVLAVAACGPKDTHLSEEFKDTLADWSAGKALEEGIERQRDVDDATAPGDGTLQPGAPIWVQEGKSRIIEVPVPVKRVSIADPEIAGIVVLGPTTLMINGKVPDERRRIVDTTSQNLSVNLGTTRAVTSKPLTPVPDMRETTLVLWDRTGLAQSHTVFVAKFLDRQVMLEVTVAEVNRTALEEHGMDFISRNSGFSSNLFLGGGRGQTFTGGRAVEGNVPGLNDGPNALLPFLSSEGLPTFAFRLPDKDIAAFFNVLQTEGLASILAQPRILALSGQPAVFQVGGELPIRTFSSFVAEVEFKPFGTLVNFVPRVTDERDIFLTVTPEVSEPDFNSTVEGIPTFRTRRASTSVHLKDGETFVIGGLLSTRRRESVAGIPYLQDIPLVGHFFRNTSYEDQIIELVVVVTPYLMKPIPAGESIRLPTDRPPLSNEEIRTKPHPAKATRPRAPGMGTGATLPGLP